MASKFYLKFLSTIFFIFEVMDESALENGEVMEISQENEQIASAPTVSAFSVVQGLVDKSPKEVTKTLKDIHTEIVLNANLDSLFEAADKLVCL